MKIKKKILFIIGTPNQTSQMFQISEYLKNDYDCYFSQFFGDHWITKLVLKAGFLETTIHSGHFKQKADQFLAEHGLKSDYRGETLGNKYDLVFMCNDMTFCKIARKTKSIYIQEGMIDPVTRLTKLTRFFGLPGMWALNTSLNGCSNRYDFACVASEGYKEYMMKWGVDEEKLFVTGIPNFDNAAKYIQNDFPHKNYVLVCSTDFRETLRTEDRPKFIKECVEIAGGRPLIWKLHPNEKYDRAIAELKEHAPAETLVFQAGNTNEMIANCEELITQYSSVVYMGMALGKKVRSLFTEEELKQNMPIQNGGKSAENIANLAREFLEFKGSSSEFRKGMHEKAALITV